MVDEAVPLYFDIVNAGDADAAHDAVVFEDEFIVLPAGKQDGRLVDGAAERLVRDGLDYEVHRRDRVAVDRILHHIRDKDDDDGIVYLAKLVRASQPVHAGHLDIHKDDVCIRLIICQKRQGIRVLREGEPYAVFFAVALDMLFEDIHRICLVFHSHDPDHFFSQSAFEYTF